MIFGKLLKKKQKSNNNPYLSRFKFYMENKSKLLKDKELFGDFNNCEDYLDWTYYLNISGSQFDSIMQNMYKKNPNGFKSCVDLAIKNEYPNVESFTKKFNSMDFVIIPIDDVSGDYWAYNIKSKKIFDIDNHFRYEAYSYNNYINEIKYNYYLANTNALNADKELGYNVLEDINN